MYYATGSGYNKTVEARRWTMNVFHQLSTEAHEAAFEELRRHFDETKHVLVVEMTAFYPKEDFITKKGTISARTIDASNWEKSLLDCLLLKKFFGLPSPEGCMNMNTDDKFVVELRSLKRISETGKPRLEASITVLDLDVVNNID
jgi:hypothetical protein